MCEYNLNVSAVILGRNRSVTNCLLKMQFYVQIVVISKSNQVS